MDADQGAVEHQVGVVAILDQLGEHPLPDTGLGPAGEAGVDALPLAVALGRSGQCAPDRRTHKTPFTNNRLSAAVRPGSPALPGSSGPIRDHCASFNS